ncbi:hypothetical protein H2200_007337 [Cladophialophora chaetospira]|uniref:Cutinase n=1 Tax=Cladophialophora chaetospira TaxID=386627 RepID=A0AA38X7R1_9EURO|nr:hypothetical protein H2200_007337 [Cladophialophora chaetospira]
MKVSWFAAISVALILNATPALSQDEFTSLDADPTPAPAPDATTTFDADPTPPPTPDESPAPEAEPSPTPAPDAFDADPSLQNDPHYVQPSPDDGNVPTDEGVDPNAPHLPEDCNGVRIFSARGSNEPYPGRGGEMLGALCYLFEQEGVSCDYEDVVYPANISWSGIYCESANAGSYAGQAQLTDYVDRCPDSKVVLMGYSQGADVVGDMLGGGGGTLFGCNQAYNPPLSRDTTPGSAISAVVTFGSPRHTANQPYNFGRGSNYTGVLGRQGEQLTDLNAYSKIMAMGCNAGDPVCAVGSEPVNITAHWSYYDEYTDIAAHWVVATALGQSSSPLRLDGSRPQNDTAGVTQSNSSSTNGSEDSSRVEDGALSLRSNLSGGMGVLGIVALVTAGLVSII